MRKEALGAIEDAQLALNSAQDDLREIERELTEAKARDAEIGRDGEALYYARRDRRQIALPL